MGKNLYLKNVTTLQVDLEKCIGCGRCLEVCPHAVLAMTGKKICVADLDACMECGACAMNCPVEAITVQAGVGCAQAVLNSLLGRKGCCNLGDDCSSRKTDSCC
jgi:NAD-dependent dihydropyrimidine dehydrogenase PreA subunit